MQKYIDWERMGLKKGDADDCDGEDDERGRAKTGL